MNWINSPWVTAIGLLTGIAGTAFGVWAYFATLQTKEITHDRYSRYVFNGAQDFDALLFVDGREISNGITISETAIVVWNSGSTAFTASDVRKPITFSIENSPGFFGVKLLETKAIVENNFSLETAKDSNGRPTSVKLNFKVFDPGMAAKVTLLHNGPGSLVDVDANMGPGLSIAKSEKTLARRLIIGGIVVASIAAFVVSLLGFISPRLNTRTTTFIFAVLMLAIQAILFSAQFFPALTTVVAPLSASPRGP